MGDWVDLGGCEERCGGLSREAYRRPAWGSREARVERTEEPPSEDLGKSEERSIEVRWGLQEDDALVAKLLELNGIPRWVAFEERFILAEEEGEVLAALSHRMASKRLLLELLVADPWAQERFLAAVLYEGAVALAGEAGIGEVRARPTTTVTTRLRSGIVGAEAVGGVRMRAFPSRSGVYFRWVVGVVGSLPCWASLLYRSFGRFVTRTTSDRGGS